jgi:F-type H+-transporting ATPase subunit delta
VAASSASRRYARAVFELALERKELDAWSGWLGQLGKVASDKEAGPILSNRKVPIEQKVVYIERFLSSSLLLGASPLALNLLKLLVKRNLLSIAGDVAAEYADLLNSHNGIAPATVKVAAPIAKDQEQAIAGRLAALTGKKIEMKVEVDPNIIGGIVARVGDQLYDGSLRRRFELLKKTLA